jgi:cbb3-type cytochrome oxidase subunit 3
MITEDLIENIYKIAQFLCVIVLFFICVVFVALLTYPAPREKAPTEQEARCEVALQENSELRAFLETNQKQLFDVVRGGER